MDLVALPPSRPEGDQYIGLVDTTLSGRKLGDDSSVPPLKAKLKLVFQDDTLQQVEQMTDPLNINLQLGGTVSSAKAKLQAQLDHMSPDNPEVPILTKYIDICNDLLQGSVIPGLNISVGVNADGSLAYVDMNADKVTTDSTGKVVTTSTKVGGNPFLKGNAYTQFVIQFLILAKLLMENQAVGNKYEIASMVMVVEMASCVQSQILASGEAEKQMHIKSGISAAIGCAAAGVGTIISVAGTVGNSRLPEQDTPTAVHEGEPPKAPDLNNPNEAIKDPNTGKQAVADVPDYVEINGKVYDNTKAHIQTSLGKESVRGGDFAQPKIKGVNVVKNPDGTPKVENGEYVKSPPAGQANIETHPAKKYAQYRLETRPDPRRPGRTQLVKVKTAADMKAENAKRFNQAGMWNAVGPGIRDVMSKGAESWAEMQKAGLSMNKATADGLKEIFSMVQRLLSTAMDKSAEAVKQNHDLLDQLIQQLNALRQKLYEAIQASLKRTSR